MVDSAERIIERRLGYTRGGWPFRALIACAHFLGIGELRKIKRERKQKQSA